MPESATRLPDQVVMPLLDRIVRESLDEDYQVVAARKSRERPRSSAAQRPPSPGSGRPRQVAAAVMAVFGVLVAIAAIQTSRNAPEANASMASLVEQAQERREGLADLQAELDKLRTSTNALRGDVAQAQADEQAQAARITRLEARTGVGAVRGPGLRISVDDAPDGDVSQQVRDSDLATLVDGLWDAGAEAISVNGKRLTNLTAFDNVGPAIHIAGTPLVRPYTILVIGNPDTLQADLLDTTMGQRWFTLVQSLGFDYAVKPADSLSLPAARPHRLRVVRPFEQTPERPGQDAGAGGS
ncbi:DUF881 domain-containing protein [Nocardioides agariphilus]|jgi:uncharacterized protein YlxW (UPF0749 family)|uniref:DUF881 domain-containing protein n=1 Tax=Nocardioides agariphilus TaxID=433664 RepID=A0A930YLM4_9ACTN|nr:DUF881 domain-containing protein [Nocardioides agariphilus]MBF4767219.1 DUF881 domain-containing protein [Nocardioides agariphilus]